MNAHNPITDGTDVNMTSKGQVLIPKAIRDRIGLRPGQTVRVGINDRGEAVVLPKEKSESPEECRARILEAIESVRGSMNLGMTTDEYMRMIRGPYEDDE
jgi:AbrB family looped-hinge helix DNA binding protein